VDQAGQHLGLSDARALVLATHALDKARDALEAGPDDVYKSSKQAYIS
jgi:hypothetical protein